MSARLLIVLVLSAVWVAGAAQLRISAPGSPGLTVRYWTAATPSQAGCASERPDAGTVASSLPHEFTEVAGEPFVAVEIESGATSAVLELESEDGGGGWTVDYSALVGDGGIPMLSNGEFWYHRITVGSSTFAGSSGDCYIDYTSDPDDVCASFPNFGSFQLVATGLEPDDVVTTCTEVGPYWILAVDSISALQFSMDTVAYPFATEYEREVENAWVELEPTGTHPSAISNVPINGFRVTVEDCTGCGSSGNFVQYIAFDSSDNALHNLPPVVLGTAERGDSYTLCTTKEHILATVPSSNAARLLVDGYFWPSTNSFERIVEGWVDIVETNPPFIATMEPLHITKVYVDTTASGDVAATFGDGDIFCTSDLVPVGPAIASAFYYLWSPRYNAFVSVVDGGGDITTEGALLALEHLDVWMNQSYIEDYIFLDYALVHASSHGFVTTSIDALWRFYADTRDFYFYTDSDGDGYGDPLTATCSEWVPGGVTIGGDCNDTDSASYPGAIELCTGNDNDCDGTPDYPLSLWRADADGDGFGSSLDAVITCSPDPGYILDTPNTRGDCNDTDATVFPGAPELVCEGIDRNCDGNANPDIDGDGAPLCGLDGLPATGDEDCDDTDSAISPLLMFDFCDGIDNDCDGTTDETNNRPEVRDGRGVDDDCDTFVDEGFSLASSPCELTFVSGFPSAVNATVWTGTRAEIEAGVMNYHSSWQPANHPQEVLKLVGTDHTIGVVVESVDWVVLVCPSGDSEKTSFGRGGMIYQHYTYSSQFVSSMPYAAFTVHDKGGGNYMTCTADSADTYNHLDIDCVIMSNDPYNDYHHPAAVGWIGIYAPSFDATFGTLTLGSTSRLVWMENTNDFNHKPSGVSLPYRSYAHTAAVLSPNATAMMGPYCDAASGSKMIGGACAANVDVPNLAPACLRLTACLSCMHFVAMIGDGIDMSEEDQSIYCYDLFADDCQELTGRSLLECSAGDPDMVGIFGMQPRRDISLGDCHLNTMTRFISSPNSDLVDIDSVAAVMCSQWPAAGTAEPQGTDYNCSLACSEPPEDLEYPLAACSTDHTVRLDEHGAGVLHAADVDAGSTDSFGSVEVSITRTEFSCADVAYSPIHVEMQVSNVNDHRSSCLARVLVSAKANADYCDGGTLDDCDPSTEDGSAEPWWGQPCDSADSDACFDDVYGCVDGVQTCIDVSNGNLDLCNDNTLDDCLNSTNDGTSEAWFGTNCDSPNDDDLCQDDLWLCIGGVQTCFDVVTDSRDLCNDNTMDDCNVASPDGSGETWFGEPCDSESDTDSCMEAVWTCEAGIKTCNEPLGDALDVCNGVDDDCDPNTVDGLHDPLVGVLCDGPDADGCLEGFFYCVDGNLTCADASASNFDICNGVDDDCDESTPDGIHDPFLGSACDSVADLDLCLDGSYACVNGSFVCEDDPTLRLDLCNLLDDDCNGLSADGADEPLLGLPCDGDDADLCTDGVWACVAGAMICSDDAFTHVEICDGFDNDCDSATPDGAAEESLGEICDGDDIDECIGGVIACLETGVLGCNDDDREELCEFSCTPFACNNTVCDSAFQCQPACDSQEDCAVGFRCDFDISPGKDNHQPGDPTGCVPALAAGALCQDTYECGDFDGDTYICKSNECVPLPFEDCPAVNKNARDSNEFFLLIALAAIGGLALIAMAISLMWACCCSGESKEKVDHFVIAGIGLALIDTITDVVFVSTLGGTWFLVGLAAIVVPTIINLVIAIGFFWFEVRRGDTSEDMKVYASTYLVPMSAVILLSCLNLEILALFASNLFGHKFFKAPVSDAAYGVISYGRLTNVLLEDVTSLVLTMIVVTTCSGFSLVPALSVTLTVVSILILVIQKIILTFVTGGHVDQLKTTNRGGGDTDEAPLQEVRVRKGKKKKKGKKTKTAVSASSTSSTSSSTTSTSST